jgi:hypothetical protein
VWGTNSVLRQHQEVVEWWYRTVHSLQTIPATFVEGYTDRVRWGPDTAVERVRCCGRHGRNMQEIRDHGSGLLQLGRGSRLWQSTRSATGVQPQHSRTEKLVDPQIQKVCLRRYHRHIAESHHWVGLLIDLFETCLTRVLRWSFFFFWNLFFFPVSENRASTHFWSNSREKRRDVRRSKGMVIEGERKAVVWTRETDDIIHSHPVTGSSTTHGSGTLTPTHCICIGIHV